MTGPENGWALLIESGLSDQTYGARITIGPTTDEDSARAQFAAVAAGQSSDLVPIPDQARIVACGADQLAVVVTHRLRSAAMTRVSLVRVLR